MLAAPFQGVIVLVGLIQGLRAKPLALKFARFFAPFQGGRVIDVTQGRRAKRLPLATFCRASGAG